MSINVRFWSLILLFCTSTALRAADYFVTAAAADGDYTINSQSGSPALTLTRGQTYTFEVMADASHPFWITTQQFDNDVPGITGNNTAEGTITYVVPLDAPDTMLYLCSIHGFGNIINIIDPPPPPAPNVKIISISLTTSNVTLKSIGTNGWMGIPEFSSNLLSTSWSVVPNYNNTFANGTNTAVFPRLEVICGPNVFLRVRNTTNQSLSISR